MVLGDELYSEVSYNMVDLKYSDLAGNLNSREPFPPHFLLWQKMYYIQFAIRHSSR